MKAQAAQQRKPGRPKLVLTKPRRCLMCKQEAVVSRGLCNTHYQGLRRSIGKEIASWEEAVSLGLCLEKWDTGPNTVRARIKQAKAKLKTK